MYRESVKSIVIMTLSPADREDGTRETVVLQSVGQLFCVSSASHTLFPQKGAPAVPTNTLMLSDLVIIPSVAEIVIGYVPSGVVKPDVIVTLELHDGEHSVGLNAIFIPDGMPLAENVTACVFPRVRVVNALTEFELPCGTLTESGLTSMLKSKSPGGTVWRVYVADLVLPPPVPETVMLWFAAAAEEDVLTVNCELQGGVQLVGEKLHEIPVGGVAHERDTVFPVPCARLTLTVVCSLSPITISPKVGETDMPKSKVSSTWKYRVGLVLVCPELSVALAK